MIRIILYLALLLGVATGLAWFADRPGTVTINWLGYEAAPSVFQAVIILTLLVLLLAALVWLMFTVINAPRRVSRRMERRRQRKGMQALQEGIFAAGSGDQAKAAKFAGLAQKYVPNSPLTKLLRAQAAQLNGDRIAAQRIFTSMLDEDDTKLLGLRGLFQEAKREGQLEAAKLYVQQALAINPSLPWPAPALFEFQCREHDWQGALETLNIARQHKIFDRKAADRRRAVLLTALAAESEERGDGKALELALEAHKLAPELVPAAAIAGRVLAAEGNTQKAAKIIAETWELAPHPDLAAVYAHARPGDSPRDRLARVKSLASLTPGHAEAAIAVAATAIEARAWDEARAALDYLLRDKPTARVCTLMARIEGGEKRDAGRVREWLARALRAPRDPAWIADGVISDEWAPVSPITQTLDAFVWEVPPEQTKPQLGDERMLAELARLEADTGEPRLDAGDATLDLEPVAAPQPHIAGVEPASVPSRKAAPHGEPSRPETVMPASPAPVSAIDKRAVPAPGPRAALPPAFPASATGWEPGPERPQDEPPAPAISQQPTLGDAASAAKGKGKQPSPKIFIPARPPDDPGPETVDADEIETPLTRFRMPLKDPA